MNDLIRDKLKQIVNFQDIIITVDKTYNVGKYSLYIVF